ncbi:MAG: glycosyltransferase family A protein [Dehalococcoidia bacterium]
MIEETARPRDTGAVRAPALARTTIRDRFIEAYPGLFAWLLVLAPIWLTLIHPMAGLAFVLVATGVFLLKVGWFGVGAIRNFSPVQQSCDADWAARLAEHQDWRDYRLILMVRAFREGNVEMLRESIRSVLDSSWPHPTDRSQIEIVYATEVTDPVTPPIVEALAAEFAGRLTIRQVIHPVEPQVLPGPSSAMHYAGQVLYDEIVSAGGDPTKVLVADFDSDTRLHPEYLSCLLATYLADPNRQKRVYQPAVMFTLDYWSAPLHSRIAALGTSALTLGWNRWPEIAFTGAAANLALLHSVDFWPTLSHSQDSGVELRLRMRYGEDFTVSGLPVTTYVYPVMIFSTGTTLGAKLRDYWTSFKVLFRQSARWREGPLDEFIEAVKAGNPYYTGLKLWSGIERDTLTILPGWGFLATRAIIETWYPRYDLSPLTAGMPFVLSVVTVLGLLVFWRLLATPLYVPADAPLWRRAVEMGLFYLVMPVLLPLITGVAGLKTSTAYALGKKPTGAYIPTPK